MTNSPQFDPRSVLDSLPEQPGVYRMLDADGGVLYVGKAKSLKKRVSSYFQKNSSSPRIVLMVSQIAGIDTTVTRSEAEALLLENNLIKRIQPPFNILFRDDKSYPYLQLTRSAFPQLTFFRGLPDRKADYFGPYPSAFAVRSSVGLLQKMFRLRTCSESFFENRSRACLLYQIKRCSGPCVGHVNATEYAEDVRLARLFLEGRGHEVLTRLSSRMDDAATQLAFEQAALFRDQITMLRKLQERQYVIGAGCAEADIVIGYKIGGMLCINLAMVRAGEHLGDKPMFPQHTAQWTEAEAVGDFLRQHYAVHPLPARIITDAAITQDVMDDLSVISGREALVTAPRGEAQRAWVEMARKNAHLVLQARERTVQSQARKLEVLRDVLELNDLPMRIECFDISHTHGEATVASCVVCLGGEMKPSQYRRFNISGVAPGDDYGAITQAVRRRYGKLAESMAVADNEESLPAWPDLVIIDGGPGQVGAALGVLNELGVGEIVPLIGIAKGAGRKEGLEKIVFAPPRLPLQLPLDHSGFLLLLEVRNEAHRFAVAGHRARRSKTRKESQLDGLPGIGPQRRKKLLANFGSLAGVRDATMEQLSAVPGFNQKLAELIYRSLH